MDETLTVALTPRQAARWARGFPRWVVEQVFADGELGHFVHPPPVRVVSGGDRQRALEANALLWCSNAEDVDDLFLRLERAADLDAELTILDAIRRVHDTVCAERRPSPHFRNRLYDILDWIATGVTGRDLVRFVGRMKTGVLPELAELEAMFAQALAGGLRPPSRRALG